MQFLHTNRSMSSCWPGLQIGTAGRQRQCTVVVSGSIRVARTANGRGYRGQTDVHVHVHMCAGGCLLPLQSARDVLPRAGVVKPTGQVLHVWLLAEAAL